MLKALVLVFLAYLVWRGLESVLGQVRGAVGPGPGDPRLRSPRPASGPAGPQVVETLVPCADCGVHVPRSRTLTGPGGQLFCSEACRRRAAQSA